MESLVGLGGGVDAMGVAVGLGSPSCVCSCVGDPRKKSG